MRFLLALVVALVVALPSRASSPSEAVTAASLDIQTQPASLRPYLRYISLYNVPKERRDGVVKSLIFWTNSLSREGEFAHPRKLTDDLCVINILDFAWSREVWEKLLGAEPYFHSLIKTKAEEKAVIELWPGGVWPQNGQYYPKGSFRTERKVSLPGGTKVAQAPWLDTKAVLTLVTECQTEVPIVRADWFIVQTAIQTNRKAGYYDFLGLGKNQKDFEDLILADRAKSIKAKKEINGILARSGVTLSNRVVIRLQSITGAYWVTQDYKKSVDRQNVIRLLDKDLDPPQGDASEQYGVLPNGLFAFWLQNEKGERQDFAPDFIASDGQAPGNDRRVHIGLSCVRCHIEGIRPVNDVARRLYQNSVQLASPDYEKYKRLRQLYLSDLPGQVTEDQLAYAKKLNQLVGVKPPEMAKLFARTWEDYVERDLTRADVARELGVPEAKMLAALKEYGKSGLDPVLAQLIQDPPIPLLRDHFEEVFSLAQAAIRGYRP